VLKPSHLPASVLRELPRRRSDYLRIATAAGRCYLAIKKIRGSSDAMTALRQDIWSACFGESLLHTLELEQVIRDHDVLILGDTGTGKEAVAQAFLDSTPGGADGKAAPQSALNAAAIPDTLVESELFGHVKGAFTGATEARLGRLRVAAGGSFFLDEVGDLPATTQVKLLRVMETNEISPLGSDVPQEAHVRYVAATHKDLSGMVDRGEFRRDLYGRLAGITLHIPPLRERPEDIEEIGMSFIESYLQGNPRSLDTKAMSRWLRSSEARNYGWPGNVRELQNALRNLLLGLPPGLTKAERVVRGNHGALPPAIVSSQATLEFVEEWYVDKVLRDADNNLTQAAQRLGVDRSTLRRRLKRKKSS
jgi:transcriptional regulator with PAS, ATPase and Fis domain